MPLLHLCAHQEEFPKAQMSLLLISVQTDSMERCRPSGYLISEWSSFQISEKNERKLSLPWPPFAGRQAWGQR